jgi:hypothetical protein
MNKHISSTNSGGPLVAIYRIMNTLLSLNLKYINRSMNRYNYRYNVLLLFVDLSVKLVLFLGVNKVLKFQYNDTNNAEDGQRPYTFPSIICTLRVC